MLQKEFWNDMCQTVKKVSNEKEAGRGSSGIKWEEISFFTLYTLMLFYFILFFALLFIYLFCFSQARGQIRATVAGLHHSHSNKASEPCLQPIPQLTVTLNP